MVNTYPNPSNPFGVQGIIRQFGPQFRQQYNISPAQQKTFHAVKNCRTISMGGHADQCDQCGHMRYFYNSCRNRHCPQCQGLKQTKWVDKLACDLLPVAYFHIVFTIPSEINPLALVNQEIVYDILFKAASETLLTLAKDPKYLNSTTGIVAILHTWGQNLMFHPHLHTMVPAGGWNKGEQKWHDSRRKFFIPVRVVSALFRGKFLSFLKNAFNEQQLTFAGSITQLKSKKTFNSLLTTLYRKDWVVYTKKPFKNSSHIINYLGRYSHRIAISNSRIREVEGDLVTFSMKDYRDGKKKLIQLKATEFIRRFLLHVLPKGFCKIRYYGLFATRNRNTLLERCRKAMGKAKAISKFSGLTWQQVLQLVTGKDVDLCPVCQTGRMTVTITFKPAGALA
jgi:hypothetical protein